MPGLVSRPKPRVWDRELFSRHRHKTETRRLYTSRDKSRAHPWISMTSLKHYTLHCTFHSFRYTFFTHRLARRTQCPMFFIKLYGLRRSPPALTRLIRAYWRMHVIEALYHFTHLNVTQFPNNLLADSKMPFFAICLPTMQRVKCERAESPTGKMRIKFVRKVRMLTRR